MPETILITAVARLAFIARHHMLGTHPTDSEFLAFWWLCGWVAPLSFHPMRWQVTPGGQTVIDAARAAQAPAGANA